MIIGYYVTFIMGFIFGYFIACLMVMARHNTEDYVELDN